MTSPDTRLAALLLTNRLTDVEARPLRAREFWTVVGRTDDRGIELGALLDADEAAVAALLDDRDDAGGEAAIDAHRLCTLLAATRSLAFELERLADGGVSVISALDEGFPPLLRDRLQHGCPASLFVAGPASWLTDDGVAIVGADDAGAPVHDVARAAVAAAVVAGWVIVTDRTTAIGQTVTEEALACEGAVVAVAADGINRAARAPAERRLVQREQLCLISPYPPDAASSDATVRARDAIVHAIAHTTLVTAAHGDPDGAAIEAARREPASVATWLGDGSTDENQELATLGARPVGALADLYDLF